MKFGALRGPDGAWLRLRRPPRRREDVRRLQPEAPRRRRHRHLPPRAPRSRRAHRGHRRRHRRAGQGGLRAPHRPLRGGRRDHPPRRTPSIPSSICKSSTPWPRAGPRRHLPGSRRARDQRHALWRLLARAAHGQQDRRAAATSGSTCRASRATTAAKNATAVARLHAFAAERGMTPAQLALAWVLAKQPTLVPVVGARTRAQLDDVARRARTSRSRRPTSRRSRPSFPRTRSPALATRPSR